MPFQNENPSEWFYSQPPLPPPLYHGGGMSLLIHLRVNPPANQLFYVKLLTSSQNNVPRKDISSKQVWEIKLPVRTAL